MVHRNDLFIRPVADHLQKLVERDALASLDLRHAFENPRFLIGIQLPRRPRILAKHDDALAFAKASAGDDLAFHDATGDRCHASRLASERPMRRRRDGGTRDGGRMRLMLPTGSGGRFHTTIRAAATG